MSIKDKPTETFDLEFAKYLITPISPWLTESKGTDPKDWIPEMVRRVRLLRILKNNRKAQLICLELCKRNPVFFINNFAWTYDPRNSPHHRPMVVWKRQETIVNAMCGIGESNKTARGNLRPVVLDKARDYGVSVIMMMCCAYFNLFIEGADIGVMSRTHTGVYDRTYNSLIGKLLYCYDHLPKWIVESDQITARTQPVLVKNERNGNVILGSATTDGAWRGPRVRRVMVDESAHVPNLQSIMTSLSATTDAPCLVSSPSYKAHPMYRILSGEDVEITPYGVSGEGWIRLTMPYTTDPRKDEAWAIAKAKTMTIQAFAQEYKLDWTASAPARIWPEFDEARNILSESDYNLFLANSEYHRDSKRYVAGWDFGVLSLTETVWTSYCPSSDIILIHDYRAWRERMIEDIIYDIKKVELDTDKHYFSCKHVGDPSGTARQANLSSWIGEAKKHGISIATQRIKNPQILREKIRSRFNNRTILFAPNCAKRHDLRYPSLTESVANYRLDVKAGEQPKGDEKPCKDVYSHGADALMYALAKILENTNGIGEALQAPLNFESLGEWRTPRG